MAIKSLEKALNVRCIGAPSGRVNLDLSYTAYFLPGNDKFVVTRTYHPNGNEQDTHYVDLYKRIGDAEMSTKVKTYEFAGGVSLDVTDSAHVPTAEILARDEVKMAIREIIRPKPKSR